MIDTLGPPLLGLLILLGLGLGAATALGVGFTRYRRFLGAFIGALNSLSPTEPGASPDPAPVTED